MYLYTHYSDLELSTTQDNDAWVDDVTVATVEQHLPDWIVARCDRYVDDYHILGENWTKLCAQWNTTPQEILIVRTLPTEDWSAYTLLERICNQLTRAGYVIRTQQELVPCPGCGGAQLTERVWSFLKARGAPAFAGADTYPDRCRACRA
jgi:hypothetical protein